MFVLTLWMFATCFRRARDRRESSRDGSSLDALSRIAAPTRFVAFFFLLLPSCSWSWGVCTWVCSRSRASLLAPKSPPLWPPCAVCLYVRCVPPVCWYIMPPQVVMIPVSGALGQCPTHPWWPPCCAMLAWHYFVAAGMKRWPKPKSWWKHILPAMLRTLRSLPPCEWRVFID